MIDKFKSYLFESWEKDKQQVIEQARTDAAYELGFRAAWNTRLTDRLEAENKKLLEVIKRILQSNYFGVLNFTDTKLRNEAQALINEIEGNG